MVQANAWEEKRDAQGPLVHLFVCSMEEFDLNVLSKPSALPDMPKLHHIIMDTDTGEVSDTCMSDVPVDFPQVHQAAVGLRCQYGALLCESQRESGPVGSAHTGGGNRPRMRPVVPYSFEYHALLYDPPRRR